MSFCLVGFGMDVLLVEKRRIKVECIYVHTQRRIKVECMNVHTQRRI